MTNSERFHLMALFLGDIVSFWLALYLSLAIRVLGLPSIKMLNFHVVPFSWIFLVWALVFYISGLYDNRNFVFKDKLFRLLINSQLINSGIVILVFYFIPKFLIAPKTTLVIDLVITLVLLFCWRISYVQVISKVERESVFVMGEDGAALELKDALSNPHFGMRLVTNESAAAIIILNMSDPIVASKSNELYPLLFTNVRFLDLGRMYEDIFGRVPLQLLTDKWVIENISLQPKPIYTFFKRAMDIIIALPLALLSIISWPLVYLGYKIEDGGGLFSSQIRVGQGGRPVRLLKLRTMSNANDQGKWGNGNKNTTTKVGEFLRRTRLDEFPQLWNVIRGDLSLIGPRPEFSEAVREYEKNIPYYKLRHVIKPGLSGWAQINQIENPHHDIDVSLTSTKLSYDLYYVKNRSFLLDLKIALKTIKTLLSRVGA